MKRHFVFTLPLLGWMLADILFIVQAQPPENHAGREARDILNRAVQTTSAVKDDQSRIEILLSVAETQAKAGYVADALKTVLDIPYLHKDEIDTGIQRIQIGTGKNLVMEAIAVAQAKAGDIAAGLKTLTHMEAESKVFPSRGGVGGEIAKLQAKAGDFEGALKTAATIGTKPLPENVSPTEEMMNRAEALGVIAGIEAVAGRPENAAGALKQARQAADAEKDKRLLRDLILSSIASGQREAGDIAGAIATATAISYEDSRFDSLRAVIEAQTETEDIAGTLKTLSGFPNKGVRGVALLQIAKVQAKTEDKQNAGKNLEEARKLLAAIQNNDTRMGLFISVAVIQAQIGDIDGALKTAAAQHPYYGSLALTAIAEEQAGAGHVEGVQKAIAALLKSEPAQVRSNFLLYPGGMWTARAQAKAGDKEGAAKTLQQGLQTVAAEKDGMAL
jgi:hypothetical protein